MEFRKILVGLILSGCLTAQAKESISLHIQRRGPQAIENIILEFSSKDTKFFSDSNFFDEKQEYIGFQSKKRGERDEDFHDFLIKDSKEKFSQPREGKRSAYHGLRVFINKKAVNYNSIYFNELLKRAKDFLRSSQFNLNNVVGKAKIYKSLFVYTSLREGEATKKISKKIPKTCQTVGLQQICKTHLGYFWKDLIVRPSVE